MSNTEFKTVPCVYGTDQILWYNGDLDKHSSDVYFHLGNAKTWSRDVNWGFSGGNIQTSSVKISGENGREHHANYKMESDQEGLFPPMESITGFTVEWAQNSTKGHCLWLRNVGIEMIKDGADDLRWGSNDLSKKSDTDYHSQTWGFSSSDTSSMRGYRFYRFWFRVSSANGSGTRSTELYLKNFRLRYESQPTPTSTTNRWVVGKYRKKAQAFSEAIQV